MSNVQRGLQTLLPRAWPPLIVRLISDFAGLDSCLCHQMRLSMHGVLHDVYCILESKREIVVLTVGGVTLRVARSECGALSWPVDLDTNPHTPKSITASWLQTVLEPRSVGSFRMFPSNEPLASSSTLHLRLRCYKNGESPDAPQWTPFFVYVRMFAPWMVLRGVDHDAVRYMREAAVLTSLLPLCQPSPAPTTYYYSAHEETGSSCVVMDDLTAILAPAAEVLPGKQLAKRVMLSLALLHGRFLSSRQSSSQVEKSRRQNEVEEEELSASERDLRSSLVHPLIFHAQWASNIDLTLATGAEDLADKEALTASSAAGGSRKSVIYVAQLPITVEDLKCGTDFDPAVVLGKLYGVGSGVGSALGDAAPPSPQQEEEGSAVVSPSSLSLIHGSLGTLEHVLATRDAKLVPSCYFVDWKGAGIGPIEVDLLDAFISCLTEAERSSRDVICSLLTEYCDCLSVLCGVQRDASALLRSCCDVARLRCFSKTRREGFQWGAGRKRVMAALAGQLSSMVL